MEELWQTVPEFPKYQISNAGRVYNNQTERIMKTSCTNFGNVKITLTGENLNDRYTRSVAQLVAAAFVESPGGFCDHVMVLDGDPTNLVYTNLVWRPAWFAWKYVRQLKAEQPRHMKNLKIREVKTGTLHESIIHAGMYHGLLFSDIWESTYRWKPVYPEGLVFEVVKRV